jgi:hypothetical protein
MKFMTRMDTRGPNAPVSRRRTRAIRSLGVVVSASNCNRPLSASAAAPTSISNTDEELFCQLVDQVKLWSRRTAW